MRTTFFRSFFIILLAAAMVLCCIGCKSENKDNSSITPASAGPKPGTDADPSDLTAEAGMPLTDTPVKLSLWMPLVPNQTAVLNTLSENEVFKELQRRTNVEIEFIHPAVGDGPTNLNLLIASNKLPDMIQIRGVGEYYAKGGDDGVENGVFIKLNDLIEKNAPNFNKLMSENPDIKKEVVTDNGQFWGFPMIEKDIQPAWAGFVVRKDWLDDLYLETPVTYDDWYTMLKKFRDEKEAAAPLLLESNATFGFSNMLAGFGVAEELYVENGKVKYGPMEPGWLEYVTMMNKWFSEGLIDKSFTTRDSSAQDQLKATEQAGVWSDGCWNLSIFTDLLREKDKDAQVVALTSPVKSKGQVNHLRQTNHHNREMYLAITPKCKEPEIAVRWIDYLYSQEGSFMANFGLADSHELVDGQYQLSEKIMKDPKGIPSSQIMNKYVLHEFSYVRDWMRDYRQAPQNVIDSMEIWNTADDSWVLPPVSLNAAESASYQKIFPDVGAIVFEHRTQFINGKKPLSEYNAMVSTIKKVGMDEVIAAYQAAYDRYKKR